MLICSLINNYVKMFLLLVFCFALCSINCCPSVYVFLCELVKLVLLLSFLIIFNAVITNRGIYNYLVLICI
uniref:Hypothetical secreted peptide n=1 Tax=Glossina morsitans morsitans TaxID=37546 RepID=D3TSP2_GLOMM